MKRVVLLLMLFIFIIPSYAQKKDSLKTGQKTSVLLKDSTQTDTAGSKNFVDSNGNGIDDRLEKMQRQRKRRHKKDIFKDEDGDGICDGKESSVGLRKLRQKRMRRMK